MVFLSLSKRFDMSTTLCLVNASKHRMNITLRLLQMSLLEIDGTHHAV